MKVQLSCDDGGELDMRIAKMLLERNLDCIFYIPTNMIQIDDMDYRIIHPRGGHHLYLKELKLLAENFEMGGHTETHPMIMRNLTEQHQWHEIYDGKKRLEKWTGQPVDSFCYPRGKYDETTIKLVKEAGFTNARTVDIGVGMKNNSPYELLAYHCANRSEYEGKDWYDVITEKIVEYKDKDDTMNVFFHCWELNADGTFDKIEKLFDFIAEL